MITVQVIGQDQIIAKLGRVPEAARNQLLKTFNRIGYGLQAYIQSTKLEGQYLHHRSGRLSASIHPEFVNSATEIKAVVGTNVEYARVHEYGFHGTVEVKQHQRKTPSGKMCIVKAHPMTMNVAEKPFMRDSLREYYPTKALPMLRQAMKEFKP